MTKRLDLSAWLFRGAFVLQLKMRRNLWNLFYRGYCRIWGIKPGKGTRFYGFPKLNRAPNSRIVIGKNCLFNSARNSVEIGLLKRCAFVTLEQGAEIIIGDQTGASGTTIVAGKSITIGNRVMIGAHSTITDTDFHNPDPSKREDEDIPTRPVVIEDHVFLGMNTMILKGVTIGSNSVIGANSVVMSSIPPNSIAMGNPCKVILKRNWGKSHVQGN